MAKTKIMPTVIEAPKVSVEWQTLLENFEEENVSTTTMVAVAPPDDVVRMEGTLRRVYARLYAYKDPLQARRGAMQVLSNREDWVKIRKLYNAVI